MKALFFLLLTANVLVGAWLLLGEPVDSVREPGRLQLQIEAGRFHLLSDADLARTRQKAERTAAVAAVAAAAAAAAATPRIEPPAANPPSSSCVEIGNFPSDSAAKKARARLAAIGLADRTSASTVNHLTRLRVTGVDPATEAQIDEILKDYPKQQLAHCAEAANVR